MQDNTLVLRDSDFVRLMAMHPSPDLRAELERAIVVPEDSMIPGVVGMNSCVLYRDEDWGDSRTVQIVYPEEADVAHGRVSVMAPVGSALLGLSVGQEIVWPFPDGKCRRLRVLAVSEGEEERAEEDRAFDP